MHYVCALTMPMNKKVCFLRNSLALNGLQQKLKSVLVSFIHTHKPSPAFVTLKQAIYELFNWIYHNRSWQKDNCKYNPLCICICKEHTITMAIWSTNHKQMWCNELTKWTCKCHGNYHFKPTETSFVNLNGRVFPPPVCQHSKKATDALSYHFILIHIYSRDTAPRVTIYVV